MEMTVGVVRELVNRDVVFVRRPTKIKNVVSGVHDAESLDTIRRRTALSCTKVRR